MLDHVSISHESGIILWQKSYTPSAAQLAASPSSPLNALVRDVFIEGKPVVAAVNTGPVGLQTEQGRDVWESGGWKMEWGRENGLGLIFVVAYHRLLQLPYIPLLLSSLKDLFLSLYSPLIRNFVASLRSTSADASSAALAELNKALEGWDKVWEKLLKRVEGEAGEVPGAAKIRRPFSRQSTPQPSSPAPVKVANVEKEVSTPGTPTSAKEEPQNTEDIAKNVEALKARLKGGDGLRRSARLSGRGSPAPESSGTESPKKGKTPSKPSGSASKVMRKWNDSSVTESEMAALDFSEPPPSSNDAPDVNVDELVSTDALGKRGKDGIYEVADYHTKMEEDDDEMDDLITRALSKTALSSTSGGADEAASSKSGTFTSLFSRLTGSKTLEKDDLGPVMDAMEKHLMSKNVAREVCEKVCEGVESRLVGKKLSALTSVKSEVRAALEASITRILTPATSTDLLLSMKKHLSLSSSLATSASVTPDPYKLVFIGVNGVGKSTTLSKVCFWLLQNDLKVLIAACDSFRSGAVEQLRTHVRNLSKLNESGTGKGMVELFERGYGRDVAGIAKEAIAHAKEQAFDVVLIDTAGRMQDNSPLMKSLSKLVSTNNPDKIVFVGEALVGNEAVDQLTKFDRSLREGTRETSGGRGGKGGERGIEGIVLTKFDTIDDKVGAALSMTYVTGQPILFVGCGQTYTDLRQLKVNHIVQALLQD